MSFLNGLVDKFRNAPKDQKMDKYGILSPLLATGEYVTSTINACTVIQTSFYADMLSGRTKPGNAHAEKSVQAYNDYVKHLPNQATTMEKANPLSTIITALREVSANLTQIEDNFQPLFGSMAGDNPEKNTKSSSLVVVGYLEKADNFCTWICSLVEHLTADAGDMIPPFRTRELLTKAAEASDFAALNLYKWNTKHGGLLADVKTMQAKGTDLPLQTATGEWIDEFAHDSQFSLEEKDLMAASLRSVMLMVIDRNHVRTEAKVQLLTARKEWLTAKVIQEQAKLRGMDINSPDYKRMHRVTEKYASTISKLEQQIERIRG